MLDAGAIGLRVRGLSPHAGDLVVDSQLSKRVRVHLSQPSALCMLYSCLSTSGWWGGHPMNTYPLGTRFGTPSALCTLSFRLLPFCSSVLYYPAVCPVWSASMSVLYLINLQRVVGRPPINTYPVGSRFGTPPALCTFCSRCAFVLRISCCHQGLGIFTVGVRP